MISGPAIFALPDDHANSWLIERIQGISEESMGTANDE